MAKIERPKRMTQHWEKDMKNVPNTPRNIVLGAAFNPQPPAKRIKHYVPINECDY